MTTILPPRIKKDLNRFAPNIVHVSSPDSAGHSAVRWAQRHAIPVLGSVHTRFETYPRYYNMAFLEPVLEAILRRLYRKCDAIVAPSDSMAQVLREQRMSYDVGIWSRGVDKTIFNPQMRDMDWRRSLGLADDVPVIGFLGRLVMEKGLDVFSDSIDRLVRRQVPHQVLVVGEGPARGWFESRLPGAVFAGFQGGSDLGRAVASMDLFFNPSITETFGNVTLEAMACGVPVVAARATEREPGRAQCHRPTRPPRRDGRICRRAPGLLRPARAAQRARPGGAEAQREIQLGPDQPGPGRNLYPPDPPAPGGQRRGTLSRDPLKPARPATGGGRKTRSHRCERLFEIGDQIVGILDANRDAHQIVGDAERSLARIGTERCVIAAGWLASVSVPPRLTASLARRKLSRKQKLSASPPLMNSEKVDPAPEQCRSKMSFWRASWIMPR